ncbi:MAG: methyltransferase [Dehalococcoidia bacterium]
MSTPEITPSPEQLSQSAQLNEMLGGYQLAALIHIAAKLGIADLLHDGPKNSQELAHTIDANPRNLYRVLRALASKNIFAENAAGQFELTPLAEPLRSDVPGSTRDWAILHGDLLVPAWNDLLYGVRTDQPAFEHVFGEGFWEYLDRNPDARENFNRGMTSRSGREQMQFLDDLDLSGVAKIVDVGGGEGGLLTAILQAHPGMRGVLFDLPEVVQGAEESMQSAGVAERCELVGGSFFDSVPSGGDLYVLQAVIHNWDDEPAITILKNCRRATRDNGRLVLIDTVIKPGNQPEPNKMADISMMLLLGALERTELEFQALFEASGFRLVNIIPHRPRSIILGEPV